LHVAGAFYYVTARGNQDKKIFSRDIERELLDEIVEEGLESCSATLHGYCWMTNHLHMVVQVSDRPLGALMQRIGSRYSRIVQKKLATNGHLFQNRYHALLFDADAYLLRILRCLHWAPVTAGIANDPREYRWSSHSNYLGMRTQPWVTTDFALSRLHRDARQARRLYEEFAHERTDGSSEALPSANPQEKRVIGDRNFINQLSIGPLRRPDGRSIEQVATEVCQELGISLEEVRSSSQAHAASRARGLIAAVALRSSVASLSQTARFLNRTASAVSRAAARYGRKMQKMHA
jgi:REP-associated tyrosine transposase